MSTDSSPKLPRPVMGAEDLTEMLAAETARLRRIETAARKVFLLESRLKQCAWGPEWEALEGALGEETR